MQQRETSSQKEGKKKKKSGFVYLIKVIKRKNEYIRKLERFLKNGKFITLHDNKKSEVFWSAKDEIPTHHKSSVFHTMKFPGFG